VVRADPTGVRPLVMLRSGGGLFVEHRRFDEDEARCRYSRPHPRLDNVDGGRDACEVEYAVELDLGRHEDVVRGEVLSAQMDQLPHRWRISDS